MASKFTYKGRAEITHLNTRKEGQESEKDLAVDVKFQTEKISSAILQQLGDFLEQALYLEGGAVRNVCLKPIEFTYEIESYFLNILGSTHYGCKVKKIVAEPHDGNLVVLTFGVSFKPSGDEVARIAEYLQESIEIELGPIDGELELEEQVAA